jgi:ABC-type amino acid transport substrate-binding protein
MLRWFVLAMLASACGHAPPPQDPPGTTHVAAAPADAAPPPGLDDDPPRLAERSVAMYQALAKLLGEPSTDCVAVAGKLDGIASEYADAIAANAKVLHAGHDKIQRLKTAIEPHQAELDTAAQTIGASSTMKACSEQPAFAKAIDRLLGEP